MLIRSTQNLDGSELEPEEIGKLIVEIFNDAWPKTRWPASKTKFDRWPLPRLMQMRMVDPTLTRRVGIRKRK